MKNSLLFLLLLFVTSCSYIDKNGDRPVARVDDEYLYESDLDGMVVSGTSPTDSLNLTNNYIDSWIQRKILIQQAEKNLTDEQLDFSRQLEDYRNSLVVYTYENILVTQRLDTIMTDQEIETYYLENQNNFLLKDNIVKINYVKIPVNSKHSRQIRLLFHSDDPDDKDKLADLCDQQEVEYFLDNTWMIFDNVLKEIPIRTYNQEEFLKYRRSIDIQDSLYVYLAKFVDFKIKEGVSPLQFERDRIKSIIINKRKIELLNTMHQDVYNEALEKNAKDIN